MLNISQISLIFFIPLDEYQPIEGAKCLISIKRRCHLSYVSQKKMSLIFVKRTYYLSDIRERKMQLALYQTREDASCPVKVRCHLTYIRVRFPTYIIQKIPPALYQSREYVTFHMSVKVRCQPREDATFHLSKSDTTCHMSVKVRCHLTYISQEKMPIVLCQSIEDATSFISIKQNDSCFIK